MELNAILWSVYNKSKLDESYPLPKDGRVSFSSDINLPESYWSAIGYISINNFSIRIDVFERIFFLARQKIKHGPFIESSDMMNPVGCNSVQLEKILKYCGFDCSYISSEKRIFYYKLKKTSSFEEKTNY